MIHRSRRALPLVAVTFVACGVTFYLSCEKSQPPPPPEMAAPAAPPTQMEKPAEPPAPPAPPPGPTGAIEGEVLLTGEPPKMQPLKRGIDPVCAKTPMNDEQVLAAGGKLQNAVLWISAGAPPAGAPPAEPATLDQVECMYRPRVQAMQAGQPLEIRNSDPTLHNVRSSRDSKTLFNNAQPPKSAPIVKSFPDGGSVIRFKCDVHPWMAAYIAVVPHGFFAVSGPDGKFSIKDVPAGTYTVTAWHELFGAKTFEAVVAAGKPSASSVTYSVEDRGTK